MKCTKCDSEMTLNESGLLFSCKCGNIEYNPDIKVSRLNLPSIEVEQIQLAFTCQICGDSQKFYGSDKLIFPICDQCKKDLNDLVLLKRK